jgi:hypothetical protein
MSAGGDVSPAVEMLNRPVCDVCRDPKYNKGDCGPGYCCAYGQIMDAFEVDCTYGSACCCVCAFCSAGTCDLRTRVEQTLGMPRRPCNDSCCVNWCNHLWCCCCLQSLELDAAKQHVEWKKKNKLLKSGTMSRG